MIEFIDDSQGHQFFYGKFGDNTLSNEVNTIYPLPSVKYLSSGYFIYDGSSIQLNNTSWSIYRIYYKT